MPEKFKIPFSRLARVRHTIEQIENGAEEQDLRLSDTTATNNSKPIKLYVADTIRALHDALDKPTAYSLIDLESFVRRVKDRPLVAASDGPINGLTVRLAFNEYCRQIAQEYCNELRENQPYEFQLLFAQMAEETGNWPPESISEEMLKNANPESLKQLEDAHIVQYVATKIEDYVQSVRFVDPEKEE